MPKFAVEIPIDLKEIMSKHSEINWSKIISDTLWSYAKKIKLLDTITSKSRLTEQDINAIDHAIKANLLNKYQKA